MNAMEVLRHHQGALEKHLERNQANTRSCQHDLEAYMAERRDIERDLADVNVALQALNPDPDAPATGPDAPLKAVPPPGGTETP